MRGKEGEDNALDTHLADKRRSTIIIPVKLLKRLAVSNLRRRRRCCSPHHFNYHLFSLRVPSSLSSFCPFLVRTSVTSLSVRFACVCSFRRLFFSVTDRLPFLPFDCQYAVDSPVAASTFSPQFPFHVLCPCP